MKQLIVTLEGSLPEVEFSGDYMTRRDLSLIIRAIGKQHKVLLREYRKRRIIEDWEAKKKELENVSGSEGTAGPVEQITGIAGQNAGLAAANASGGIAVRGSTAPGVNSVAPAGADKAATRTGPTAGSGKEVSSAGKH